MNHQCQCSMPGGECVCRMTTPTDRPVSDVDPPVSDIDAREYIYETDSATPGLPDEARRFLHRYVNETTSLRAQLAETEARYETLRRDVSERVNDLVPQLADARRQGAILGEEIERLNRQLAEAMAERDRRELARSAAEKAARMANEVRVAAEQARDRAVGALGRLEARIAEDLDWYKRNNGAKEDWSKGYVAGLVAVRSWLAALGDLSARPRAPVTCVMDERPHEAKANCIHPAPAQPLAVAPVHRPPWDGFEDQHATNPPPCQPEQTCPRCGSDGKNYPHDCDGDDESVREAIGDLSRPRQPCCLPGMHSKLSSDGCPCACHRPGAVTTPEPSGTTGGLAPDPLLCAAWRWLNEHTTSYFTKPPWWTAARDRYGAEALLKGAK